MHVRLTHVDGKMPNLALMKLAYWHRSQGHDVTLAKTVQPTLFEPRYDRVYGSAIFTKSVPLVRELRAAYPDAIVGGTGAGGALAHTVEELIGEPEYEHYDYSIYPDFGDSVGFTQRGCRLHCGFCVVPEKEGRPRSINTIADIWRPGTRPNVVLLDNDFFGQPSAQWQARIRELQDGDFRVNFNQGVNVRLMTQETAEALASVRYYNWRFTNRRLYTAWDNLGQERVFFRGLELLTAAGIPSEHVMVYMLVGYAPGETMDDVMVRYRRLKEAGCKPYPMVYNDRNQELKAFQRWVVMRFDDFIPWADYRDRRKPEIRMPMESAVE